MTSRLFALTITLSFAVLACDKPAEGTATAGSAAPSKPATTAAAAAPAAAADVSCDVVVAKLMSLDSGSPGDAEKKFYTKMCAEMPAPLKACIAAAKSAADRDACTKDVK
jgi:hypothetical protein